MADDNQMLLYAVAYETLDAALADMDAVEQLIRAILRRAAP